MSKSKLSHIEPTLHKLARSIDELKPDPDNARSHSERNLEAVMASLSKFGQQKPIVVVEDGTVIAGNATLECARRLGWSSIAVSVFTGTEQEAKAFAITDNRSSELADWAWPVVARQLGELQGDFDLESLGWGPEDLEPLLEADFNPDDWDEDPGETSGPTGDDVSGEPIKVTVAQREIIDEAIERLRTINGDNSISEGRALELICGDYIAGS